MNMTELDSALRKLRLSGMADTLEIRLLEAQSEKEAPIDFVSALVGDELVVGGLGIVLVVGLFYFGGNAPPGEAT